MFPGDNAILRYKNFQNIILHSDKVAVGMRAEITNMYYPLNLNYVKEHEAIAISLQCIISMH